MCCSADSYAVPPLLQVYEKKVTTLANFNQEGRTLAAPSPKVNALANHPRAAALRVPKVR